VEIEIDVNSIYNNNNNNDDNNIYNMLYESITIHLTNKKEVPKTMIKPSA